VIVLAHRPGGSDQLAPASWGPRLKAAGYRLFDAPAWSQGVELAGPESIGAVQARVEAAQVAEAPPKKKARRKRTRRKGA